jgi:hypothetical protein
MAGFEHLHLAGLDAGSQALIWGLVAVHLGAVAFWVFSACCRGSKPAVHEKET